MENRKELCEKLENQILLQGFLQVMSRNLQFTQDLFSQLNTTGFDAKVALNDADYIEWEYT